ncbi:unnamed protein product [Mytilus edulis]|uniref:CST complex subunit CTC1 n=1 Tax=Mytilus edulis TaxID=6550 RepID=A0A8S3RUM8_MYTED|nr:unnamed protein product [Mytilus edulis]
MQGLTVYSSFKDWYTKLITCSRHLTVKSSIVSVEESSSSLSLVPSRQESCNLNEEEVDGLCDEENCAQVTEQHGESISSINKWCALTSRNNIFVTSSGEKYVEVSGPIIPLQKAGDEKCTTLMSADAKVVLENKEVSKKSEVINIIGRILVVSEIFSVKHDSLFCVRLESDVSILIKKKEFLYWQKFLSPKKEYLFTNMKPTTLQKGAGHPVRLFVPSKNSIVYCPTPERSNILSLKDWMSKAGITEVSIDNKDYRATDKIVENNHISYQGVITSDEHAYLGIFELDQKIRLYLSYIPVTYVSLRLGTKIMVYNAHLQKSEKVKVVVPPVVALGLILLICVIYCWQRNKNLEYKYMKLTHQNEPNYDGELPGVDSCGLSDGEEDQFDSVQFKTSRGSKILNKIRGKRSDKTEIVES